jgi:transposase
MEALYRSCLAGIDVHKKMLAVVVRRETADQVEYVKRQFGTTRSEIEHLAAWLQHEGVTEAVMESTAQYWRPVWYGLEPHFRLHLTHPLKTKAPRGRKRDYRDAQRLADRWRSGDLEESFIPDAEQRSWRWLTRARVHLKKKIGVLHCQVEGLLEEAGIKLAAVVSDLFGVSSWAMLELIVKGETDPERLLREARGDLRKKRDALQQALAGRLQPTHRLLLRQAMDQVRLLVAQVEEINAELAAAMKDCAAALVRLTQVPGINLYAAQELISEIGPRAAAFPSPNSSPPGPGFVPASSNRPAFATAAVRPKGTATSDACCVRLPGERYTPKTASSRICSPASNPGSKPKAQTGRWHTAWRN